MKFIKYIISCSLVGANAFAAIKPATDLSRAPSKDSFIGYQWPLMNQNQSVTLDLDDTHSVELKADPNYAIGWKNYDSLMKKEVIVAVLDSGVDTAHPELQGKLVPGYNFTARTPELAKIYDDKNGHGTHMAGILAAVSDNNQGIAGLSGKIKVMPLKVYDGRERSGAEAVDAAVSAGVNESISARVMKAVDFAVEHKADVIHLSMGWPRANNNAQVEAAFKRAQDAGVIVVAAAGNDHHDGQIFPCAYQGVICVASVDINGKLSRFSNFGGHVDIAAPGQEILSLWPQLMTSVQFGPKGYELKSGTSQAAPFVSGTVGILKGIYPNETAAQIRARVLLSAKPFESSVTFGYLNLSKAVEMKGDQLNAPIFKGLEEFTVNPQDLSFEFTLPIEKNGTGEVAVKVRSLSSHVQLADAVKVSQDGVNLKLRVRGKVASLSSENRFKYEVSVNGRKFASALILKIKLEDFKPLTLTLSQAPTVLKSGFYSVSNPNPSAVSRYWTYASDEEKRQLQLTVWTLQNDRLQEKTVILPQVTLPQPGFNLLADDLDFDGKLDYLFLGVSKKANGEAQINFVYLDENLNIKYSIPLEYEDTIPTYRDVKDIALAKITVLGLGPLKVPVYWAQGLIPKKDTNQNALAFEVNQRAQRLYYFEPAKVNGQWHMISRSLNANGLEKKIRQSFGLPVTQDVEQLAMAPQNNDDVAQGRFSYIFGIGRGVNSKLYRWEITDLTQGFSVQKTKSLAASQFDLTKNYVTAATRIERDGLDSETNFQALYSFLTGRSLVLKNDVLSGHRVSLQDRGEGMVSIIKSFLRGDNMMTFIETSEYLRAQGRWNNQSLDAQVPVYRSTFLPGSLFSQIFVPVVVSAEQNPGIVIDNSKFFSRSIFVYAIDRAGQLTSSIERSIDLPSHCNLRRVPMVNEQNFSRLTFLCQEQDQLKLKLVDLK